MTCLSHRLPRSRFAKTASTVFAALLCTSIGISAARSAKGIHLEGPHRLRLPPITVSDSPQQVTSGLKLLRLNNVRDTNGWILSADVLDGALTGRRTGERIPASLTFRSIQWVRGGNCSAAGIKVHPDGASIEADPGFGIGEFKITFEVRYDAPAFPLADRYHGVTTFIVQ